FIQAVSADALTLNYTLENPDDYGITKPQSPLGSYTYEGMKQGLIETENSLYSLLSFDPASLSASQKVLYDTLNLSFSHALKEQDYLLYNQILSPASGFQAQLPVLLCEYSFSDIHDLEHYFMILKAVPDFYKDIIEFEKKRAANLTYMNASTVSGIIGQCRDFIADPESNLLITTFPDRMEDLSFLSDPEKNILEKKNKELVLDFIIPAYHSLILGLESLQKLAKSDSGLSSFRDGQDFYRYKVEYEVGTFRPVEEIWTLIEKSLKDANKELRSLALEDPTLFSRNFQLGVYSNTPSKILKTLEQSISDHFPAIEKVTYDVKYVPSSLEKYMNPAFYLSPPMDRSDNNVIYINGSARYKNSDLFPTLAHEGYPGHLYQTVYLNEHQKSPLQGLMSFGGYSEGWATYAELYSYRYAGLKKNESTILENNTISSLMLTSLCDIGIHYYGWNLNDTLNYLEQYGIMDAQACEELYRSVLDEPASCLKYSVGYLEILELKKKARKLMGNNYTEKAFHEYFLSMGPTWFPVLDEHMEKNIGSNNLLQQ
ncbi:MAG: DUF885 domain-containing protein, partial [Lachnoclostridium sp.]|nr:DUF885 domain-containing protein [Lachnoclostridium sp.]